MLDKAKKWLVVALLAVAVWATVELALLFHNTTTQVNTVGYHAVLLIDDSRHLVADVRKDLDETKRLVNALIIQVEMTTSSIRRAADDQQTYWKQAAEKTVASLSQLENTLKQAEMTLGQIQDTTQNVDAGVTASLAELQAAIKQANQVLADTDKLVSDPSVKGTAANVEEATAQIAATTQNLNKAMADVQQAIHRMTRPAAWWKTLLLKGIGVAADVKTLAK